MRDARQYIFQALRPDQLGVLGLIATSSDCETFSLLDRQCILIEASCRRPRASEKHAKHAEPRIIETS